MPEIIDPAQEMMALIERLRQQPASTEPTWKILPQALGIGISPGEHWELMSALNSRLLRLDTFVNSLQDEDFDQAQRQRIVQAINNLANAFRPEEQIARWQDTLKHIRADDALQFKWFSVIAKRYHPLRRISDDERSELIAKIEQTLLVLKDAKDIPDWAKLPLSDGLNRLRFTLQHLVFFGSEAAIDQLLDLYNKTAAIESALGDAPKSTPERRSKASTVFSILNCVVLAANVFWLPDQAGTAFERYQGWYLKLIVENPRLPKAERLLLAPPVPSDAPSSPSSPDEVVEPTPPRVEPSGSAEKQRIRSGLIGGSAVSPARQSS
jgi:hypothetical protein